MGDGEPADQPASDWAKQAALLVELDEAVTDAWTARRGPELWLPPGVALPEEAPGAGDLELEGMAGVDLTPQLEGTLFGCTATSWQPWPRLPTIALAWAAGPC